MGASFLVMFREALEAALVIGLVLSIIKKDQAKGMTSAVWIGAALGVGLSLLGAWLFATLSSGFEGRAEMIFEACVLSLGCLLLTSFLLWISHASTRSQLTAQIQQAERRTGAWLGIFLVILASILREGIETTLYLAGVVGTNGIWTLLGGLLGLALAAIVGLLLFWGGKRLAIGRFFGITNGLLVAFGAGLAASATHELNDLGLVPVIYAPVWNFGDEDSLMGADGPIGGFLHGLFGYSATPSLSMILVWLVYVALVGGAVRFRGKAKAA